MTCEIAVMNRHGVALAADSAVTVGDCVKIYHHSPKLFCLSPDIPVGILSYGCANIMSIPWEVVIKMYAKQLKGHRFDKLQDYATDLLRYLERSDILFPKEAQRLCLEGVVSDYWENLFLKKAKEIIGDKDININEVLRELLAKDRAVWTKYEELEGLGSAFGDEVLKTYAAELDQVEDKLFAPYKLESDVKNGLRGTVHSMMSKRWAHPHETSGLVVVGMGENEPLPILLHYNIGSIVAGKLRHMLIGEDRIDFHTSACVAPFAQTDMVDLFYQGIHEDILEKLSEIVQGCIANEPAFASQKLSEEQTENMQKCIMETLNKSIIADYKEPLMAAVACIPCHDLSRLAETLVNLTAFRAQMSTSKKETVGGPIDVALITKGEGFVWIKRNNAHNGDSMASAFYQPT